MVAGSLVFPAAKLRPVPVICSGHPDLFPVPYPVYPPPFLSPIPGAPQPPNPGSEETSETCAC